MYIFILSYIQTGTHTHTHTHIHASSHIGLGLHESNTHANNNACTLYTS